MNEPFDFVVIGGGSAGYNAASQAVRLGLKTAVIDGADELGGLCILRGCMPSKTLIESAERFRTLRRAGEFGLSAENLRVDGGAILQRKRRLVGEFADYRRAQLESGKFTLLRGWARFEDAHTLVVKLREGGETKVHAETVLIATGSKIKMAEIPGLADPGVLTTDDVLDSPEIPSSVIILGGGFSAVEFATYYSGLGVRTTILQRSSQVLKEMDEDITAALTATMRQHGVEVICDTKIDRIERTASGRVVHFQHAGEARQIEAGQVVNALGRSPNSDRLGLENAGVELRHDFVKVGLTQQTRASHIFAAGDVAGPYEIVHLAIQQAELAARNAARLLRRHDGLMEEMDYRLKMSAVFSHPEIGVVGASERELKRYGAPYRVASYPFNDHGKSLVMGEPEGFVKLLAEPETREILGGAVIGPRASELIHEIAVAMHFRSTAGDLAKIPHYHPTLSEIWTYPAEELAMG